MNFKLFDKERDTKLFKRIGIAIILLACLITIKDELVWFLSDNEAYYDDYSYSEYGDYDDATCNVAKIDLHGYLDTDFYDEGDISSGEIVQEIERADWSENIKAIILDVDSSGGSAIAGEEIANALSRAETPTVALIRDIGLSSAYWSAVGTDIIFASAISDIGCIGITYSYVDNAKQNQIEGLNYNQLSSGKFKDMLIPDKYLTYEEKKLVERDLKIAHNHFTQEIAEKRGLAVEKVRALADGSVMLGQMALDNGLIDKIGDLYAVRQYLTEIIGEEVVICQ